MIKADSNKNRLIKELSGLIKLSIYLLFLKKMLNKNYN